MKPHSPAPPAWASRFFRWYCHKDYAEDIEGDLRERFAEAVETEGLNRAKRKYIKEVVLLFRPGIIRPLEGSLELNQYGMFKNYLKTGLRNVMKSKVFSFINIAGLSLGLACCMLILLFVSNELSYDTYHKNYDSIYRILHTYRNAGDGESLPPPTDEEFQVWGSAPAGPALQEEFPAVESYFRFTSSVELLFEANGKRIQENEMIFADSTAFKIFSWDMLSGDPKSALTEPNSIVLTYSTAKKYFGDNDPVGELITVDKTETFRVTGVMEDVPVNSHFRFPGLISMATFYSWRPQIFDSWGYVDFYTYLIIRDKEEVNRIREAIPVFLKKHIPDWEYNTIALEPLSEAYLHSSAGRQPGETGSYNNIYLFSFIALFILVVAVINYMNLSTARSVDRAREIGVRKAIGANRSSLVFQFLLETMLITFVSAMIAVLLAQLLLPVLNWFAGKELEFVQLLTPGNLVIYICGCLLLGLLAGSYPALLLARFRPASVLKGTFKNAAGGARFRQGLVIFQFVLSIALIAATAIVYSQLNYLKGHSLGFSKDNILVIDFGWDNGVQTHMDQIKSELLSIDGVTGITASRAVPGDFLPNAGTKIEDPSGQMTSDNPGIYEVDKDFVPFYNIELVAGRNFSDDFLTDTTQALLINEAAAKLFGYSDPSEAVNKRFTQWGREGIIVGVLKDFNYRSLHNQVEPLSLRYAPYYSLTKISLRLDGRDLRKTVAAIEEKWNALVPDRPFLYTFLDESLNQQYTGEERFRSIFTAFAIVSVFISCLGLLGLTIYNTNNRQKEIGIRKVLGASVSSILLLFSKSFMRLYIVAFIIALPLTWLLMTRWLEGFAYHTGINPWIFVIAAFITGVIAITTIATQSIKVALNDPVKALKDE